MSDVQVVDGFSEVFSKVQIAHSLTSCNSLASDAPMTRKGVPYISPEINCAYHEKFTIRLFIRVGSIPI